LLHRLAGKAKQYRDYFSLDIYKKAINKNADDKKLVSVGKTTVIISMIVAIPDCIGIGEKLMGEGKTGFSNTYRNIQASYRREFLANVYPGIFLEENNFECCFVCNDRGFIFALFFKFLPSMIDLSFLAHSGFAKANAAGIFEIPFYGQDGFYFLLCIAGMFIISKIDNRKGVKPHGLEVDKTMFKVDSSFAVGRIGSYVVYW